MNYLIGPKANVALEIKEGNGFAFLSSAIFVVATFKGIKLQTKEVLPSSRPQFDSELVWEIDTKQLRKLRSSNTSLKLEFFTGQKQHEVTTKQNSIGYVLLNLKEAEIVSPKAQASGPGRWHRLLNLKNTFQSHKPEVLLKFMVRESSNTTNDGGLDNVGVESQPDDGNMNVGMGDCILSTNDEGLKPLQVGPPHLCTELYELSISFLAIENLIHEYDQPLEIRFSIFAISILTGMSFVENRIVTEKTTLQVWSKLEYLSAYFKEFSTLVFSLYSNEGLIGLATLNLQVLGTLNSKRNAVINSSVAIQPPDSSSLYNESSSITEELPTLNVEVQLMYKNDCISRKVDQEIQANYFPIPGIDAVTNTDIIEDLEPKSFFRHEESSLYRPFPTTANPKSIEDIITENISDRSMKAADRTVKSNNKYHIEPSREQKEFHSRSSPGTFRLSDVSGSHPAEYPKEYIRDAAIRACEELEDWKEKQQEMFEFELKKKTDRRLKKLANEWLKQKQSIEDDLKRRLEDCKSLKERLNNALQDLTQRSDILAQREDELRNAKEELDRKYTHKFQELRKASKLHEYAMEDKINEIKSENTDLLKKLEDQRKEMLRLQQALLCQDSTVITSDEANNMLADMKNLEKKLEKALESKAFFKEQWGKAVRELHRMKEEEQKQLKQQIEKNRQELQTLGLVKEISQEVGEMRKDQFTMKTIRNELSNYISSKDEPIVDVNCFSGT